MSQTDPHSNRQTDLESGRASSRTSSQGPAPARPDAKLLSLVLALSMFFVGICGISYEYGFSKLASDVLGDSVRQWAIIIGLMMLFMGLGADLQKRIGEAALVDAFILVEILLGLVGGMGPTVSLYFFGRHHEFFMLVHYGMVASVGLMIGLEIPLLTRVNQWALPELKENLGLILKMDYVGSFVGALVWVFLLPLWFDLLSMGFFLGLVNLTVAGLTALFFRRYLKRPMAVYLVGLVAFALLSWGLSRGESIELALEQRLYKDPIIHAETTPYQRLLLTEKRAGEIRLYINGHLQFSSSDEALYHEMIVHPALSLLPQVKRVLILGGGDGLAAREVMKYPIEELVLVDLDPAMTRLAMEHPILRRLNQDSLQKTRVLEPKGIEEGEKLPLDQAGHGYFRRNRHEKGVELSVMNLDAYEFVEGVPGSFDAIILDFPDPSSLALSKLYSLEFYRLLKDKLRPGGLILQQSGSPAFAKEAYLMIGRTLRAAGWSTLPLRQTIPSFGEWGFWLAGHEEFWGERGLERRLETLQRIPVQTRHLNPELIKASRHFGKEGLTAKNEKVNKILDDAIVRAYLDAWQALQ